MNLEISAVLALGLAVSGCEGHLAIAERKVRMYETLTPEAADLQRGDARSTFEIAQRMEEWADLYSATHDFPLATGRQLSQRLHAALPRYLFSASELAANPVLAYLVLTWRPRGGHRSFETPESLAAARRYAEAITASKQASFSGTYPPMGLPLHGQEQGSCFFATQAFGAEKNPGLTVRVGRGKTWVRCYLPSWWKRAGGFEVAVLVGLHVGTGVRVATPAPSATSIDFVLDRSLFGSAASAEQLHLSYTQTVHDLVLQVGQQQLLVGKERSFERIAGAELLWDPTELGPTVSAAGPAPEARADQRERPARSSATPASCCRTPARSGSPASAPSSLGSRAGPTP
jgi:hypothetical protein